MVPFNKLFHTTRGDHLKVKPEEEERRRTQGEKDPTLASTGTQKCQNPEK